MDTAPAGIGHNSGLEAATAPFLARREELLAGAARFHAAHQTIDDDATQARSTEFVRQLKVLLARIEEARAETKKPVLELQRKVDRTFSDLAKPLNHEATRIAEKMTVYAQTVERRRRKEAQAEADRKAAEADAAATAAAADHTKFDDAIDAAGAADVAQRAAEVKPAELTRVHGDYGAVSSLREYWRFEVQDKLALLRAIVGTAEQPPCLDLLQLVTIDGAAVNRMIAGKDGVHDIPGLRIYLEQRIGVR